MESVLLPGNTTVSSKDVWNNTESTALGESTLTELAVEVRLKNTPTVIHTTAYNSSILRVLSTLSGKTSSQPPSAAQPKATDTPVSLSRDKWRVKTKVANTTIRTETTTETTTPLQTTTLQRTTTLQQTTVTRTRSMPSKTTIPEVSNTTETVRQVWVATDVLTVTPSLKHKVLALDTTSPTNTGHSTMAYVSKRSSTAPAEIHSLHPDKASTTGGHGDHQESSQQMNVTSPIVNENHNNQNSHNIAYWKPKYISDGHLNGVHTNKTDMFRKAIAMLTSELLDSPASVKDVSDVKQEKPYAEPLLHRLQTVVPGSTLVTKPPSPSPSDSTTAALSSPGTTKSTTVSSTYWTTTLSTNVTTSATASTKTRATTSVQSLHTTKTSQTFLHSTTESPQAEQSLAAESSTKSLTVSSTESTSTEKHLSPKHDSEVIKPKQTIQIEKPVFSEPPLDFSRHHPGETTGEPLQGGGRTSDKELPVAPQPSSTFASIKTTYSPNTPPGMYT